MGTGLSARDAGFFFDDDGARDAAELTQKTLIDTQERMGMMLDVMPMGLLIHTEQGVLFANQEACRMLQVSKSEVVGQHLLDFLDPRDMQPVMEQFRASFAQVGVVQTQETKLTGAGQAELNIKLISCRLPWHGTPVIQVLLQDVSDMKQKEQSLRLLSITDVLTGAYNRRHVFDEAALHIERAARDGSPFSVVLLDIDHFKKINDTEGHAAGDIALIRLTRLASDLLSRRSGDAAVFARIGGEEFLVLLPDADIIAATELAQDMRRAIEAIRVDGASGKFGFTASMGVASYDPSDRTFDALLSRADAALYEAKKAGRNCVRLAAPGTAPTESDYRKAERHRTHQRARIVTGRSAPGVPCTIRDQSDTGARLRVEDSTLVPDCFVLVTEGARLNCRVQRRTAHELGVSFEGG